VSRRYTMAEAADVARQAARDIEAWLRGLSQTLDVLNVEDDAAYQQADVDLLWTTQKGRYKVEIKGDRLHQTGNFFFETVSNAQKATPGCFLYTEADLLFYYFVSTGILYILPVPETRGWFKQHMTEFQERSTNTPVGEDYYTTIGRLVPIKRVVREVEGVRSYELKAG
jgi:hypothetical protein